MVREEWVVVFDSQKYPAGQTVHTACPGPEKRPFPHTTGSTIARFGQENPSGHVIHDGNRDTWPKTIAGPPTALIPASWVLSTSEYVPW